MSDSDTERSEELERIETKVEALSELVSLAEGKVLKAKTEWEAKESIYELLFFDLAQKQLRVTQFRLLGRESYAGGMGVWAVESREAIDAIHEGDWVMAKDDVAGIIYAALLLPEFAQKRELDKDFTYKGVAIFKVDSDESDKLTQEFIRNQVNSVPDKTESYVHPRLELLKAQIASI